MTILVSSIIKKWEVKRRWYLGASVLMAVLLVSDIPFRGGSFIQAHNYLYYMLTAGVIGGLVVVHFPRSWALIALIVTIVAAISGFIIATRYHLLFSDDHPSFLYRLIQLRDNFPNIPFYNPLWNAGVEAREFFPSGVLNLYFLGLPLIYGGDIVENYNALITLVLFLICPASIFLSARLLRLSLNGAACAATLGLSSSLLWYRWALTHGTMGFIISAMMLTLVIALTINLFTAHPKRKTSIPVAIGLYLSFSLMIFWSLSILFIIPLAIIFLLHWQKLSSKILVALLAGALLLSHIPWMTFFIKASNVLHFVSTDSSEARIAKNEDDLAKIRQIKNKEPALKSVLKTLRKTATSTNPLLVFLTLPGIFLIRSRLAQLAISATLSWLLLVGFLGLFVKPQLELERFLVVAIFLAAIPAGACCAHLIGRAKDLRSAITAIIIISCFFYSPYWLHQVTKNRTSENFHVANHVVNDLSKILSERRHLGRSMFAGFILHELNEGHVAPLPAFTNAPLMASRFQHDRWLYRDIIPKEFRDKEAAGVDQYLSLMNVATVITHDRFWRQWYSRRHKKFKEIAKIGRFNVFERIGAENSYFYSGSGIIHQQTGSSIHLSLNTPEAIIKFNYFPFLQAPGCAISPVPIADEITFVKLSNCPLSTKIKLASGPNRLSIF